MKTHPVQQQIATDLTASLRAFHSGKIHGRSLEAQTWKQTYLAATLCGYEVEVMDDDLVVLVTEIRIPDKDLTDKWQRNRDIYFNTRARLHNDINPAHPELWTPSTSDSEIMASLGITWSQPETVAPTRAIYTDRE